MPHIIDRLSVLRVADVMAKDVVTVSEDQTMPEAAQVLHDNEVSSAPVVNDRGHCVGVITATDFVSRERDYSSREEGGRLEEGQGDQPHRIFSAAEDFVSCHMSPAVQTIDPGASLLKASRIMCAQHIHRLLVIDEDSHAVGIVSTMDIVAALVNVVDEMEVEVDRLRK